MADAKLMGEPTPFEFEGHLYYLDQRTFRHEAHFQTWLERDAYLALVRHKDMMGEAGWKEQSAGWRADLYAKAFCFGGDVSVRALFSEPGWREMAFLQMKSAEKRSGMTIDRELIDRIAADKDKGKELCDLILGLADPNPKKPATEAPAGEAKGEPAAS